MAQSELLKFSNKDLDVIISCKPYDRILQKASECMRCSKDEGSLLSTYVWDGDGTLSIDGKEIVKDVPSQTVFFENADYQFWISFNLNIKDAYIDTPLSFVSNNFEFVRGRNVLFGHINYGNDIGRADLKIKYILENGEQRSCRFGYDVLSVKIDYHKDLEIILRDIEKEYRMLTIDFFKRTYHQYNEDVNGKTPDIIWWQVFSDIEESFVNAAKRIIDQPHNKLTQHEMFLRADRLKRLTPRLENEIAEHRQEETRLYRTEVPELCIDTFENRFLKFAVRYVQEKYEELSASIKRSYFNSTDDKYLKHMDEMNEELKRLAYHPFFRMVGKYKGMTQDSLVLKQGTGYSQIYHDWILLSTSYSLEEGLRSLQLKDIALLYEIWCFIKVKEIVNRILGTMIGEELLKKDLSRAELSKAFVYNLSKGKKSRVIFSQKDKEGNEYQLAEVMYNPLQSREDNKKETNIENTHTYTVKQKPDIILQLNRKDIDAKYRLTYLFDAKYRIDAINDKYDTPPEDAINQMHRYRDAIYYKSPDAEKGLKKEVVGGYVLFPGNGKSEEIELADFYKSISKVNIGAFPLRPNNETSESLLIRFIENLMKEKSTVQILQEVIPQKGTSLSIGEDGQVLAVLVSKNNASYNHFMAKDKEVLYYFGSLLKNGKNPVSSINFKKYTLFVPVVERNRNFYVNHVYQIDSARQTTRLEIARSLGENETDIDEKDIRMLLHLSRPSELSRETELKLKDGIFDSSKYWNYKDYYSINELLKNIEDV